MKQFDQLKFRVRPKMFANIWMTIFSSYTN